MGKRLSTSRSQNGIGIGPIKGGHELAAEQHKKKALHLKQAVAFPYDHCLLCDDNLKHIITAPKTPLSVKLPLKDEPYLFWAYPSLLESAHLLSTHLILTLVTAYTSTFFWQIQRKMSDLEPPYGYALRRNGSCYDTENDCGQTWAPYHACCPKGTVCTHNSSDNCCRSEADCGNILAEDPHCGNTTGVLYLENNYFCCADGTAAFAWIDKGWVGCADSVSLLGSQYSLLSPVSTTQSTSTTTSTYQDMT